MGSPGSCESRAEKLEYTLRDALGGGVRLHLDFVDSALAVDPGQREGERLVARSRLEVEKDGHFRIPAVEEVDRGVHVAEQLDLVSRRASHKE